MNKRLIRQLSVSLMLNGLIHSSAWAWSSKLSCPDSVDAIHQKEVMATSAPEVKVRKSAQNDGKSWGDIVRPLTIKAIKLAKKARSEQIQHGIETSCMTGQVFVGQIVPLGDKPSGCEHHVIARPADDEHLFVQVIATCRYDWACCATDTAAPLKAGATTGFVLEGPISQGGQNNTPPKK